MTSRIQMIRALLLILIVFMLSCAEQEDNESPNKWIGHEDQFKHEFAIQEEGNASLILHKKSAKPFDGRIERNSSKHLTVQNFEGGKLNGKRLPSDVYYYIINLENGDEPITGTVTIVR